MKLYYAPNTCSLAPIILAEWLDLPLDIERVDHRNPSPEYLDVNPLGAVPALELDDGTTRTQVDAILQYFAALKPGSGLDGGADELDRLELHQWVAYLTGDYHPAFGVWFNPRRFTTDHSEVALAAVRKAAEQRIRHVASVLDRQVGDGDHVALGRRTLLDPYAFAMLRWLKLLDGGMAPHANLERYVLRWSENPGVKKALARMEGD